MKIGLSHPENTAIRKEDGFSYFPAMLQHALYHSENKLSETFKNPRLSCPSPSFNAQSDLFFPSQSHFPRFKYDGGSGKTLFTLSSKTEHGDTMTETMPHKHCLVCGNAVRPDENFCDELCESKFKSAQRKQQLLFLAFLVIMGLVLFLPSILKMYG